MQQHKGSTRTAVLHNLDHLQKEFPLKKSSEEAGKLNMTYAP